jgi:hypothetical protein
MATTSNRGEILRTSWYRQPARIIRHDWNVAEELRVDGLAAGIHYWDLEHGSASIF